jgi:membrane associated rhomboid family serine protease
VSENPGERLDRELIELMNGLRVILPGVQVLFAFLLTVPFTQRFDNITADQRAVYFAAFVCTAIASILLIAPSSYHRLRWRQRDKERLLRTSNTFAIAGVVFLGMAITAAVFLVTDIMFGLAWTALVAGLVAGLLSWCWLGLPLWRRMRDERHERLGTLVLAGSGVSGENHGAVDRQEELGRR